MRTLIITATSAGLTWLSALVTVRSMLNDGANVILSLLKRTW